MNKVLQGGAGPLGLCGLIGFAASWLEITYYRMDLTSLVGIDFSLVPFFQFRKKIHDSCGVNQIGGN
jgi:hypothetical protein